MTRKTWSTVDVSAYLDGELTPEIRVAFEATVSQDPDLQHRVAEMRQVVTLMRSVPLQEPPRNYLLTPVMVGESRPRTQRRRPALLMMRIATSVAAVAFVVTSGLTLMQRGITPQLMTQSEELPAAAILLEKEAVSDEMEMLDAPVVQAVPVEEPAESEAPAAPEVEKAVDREVEVENEIVPAAPAEPVFSAEATAEIEEPSVAGDEGVPATELGIGGDGEVPTPEIGVGGGGEASPPEGDAAGTEASAEVTDAADTPSEEAMQAEAEAAPAEGVAAEAGAEWEEAMAPEEPMLPVEGVSEMTAADDSESATRAMPQDDQAPEMAGEAIEATEATPRDTGTASGVCVPISLGVVTAALAGITFWMSRRQLD